MKENEEARERHARRSSAIWNSCIHSAASLSQDKIPFTSRWTRVPQLPQSKIAFVLITTYMFRGCKLKVKSLSLTRHTHTRSWSRLTSRLCRERLFSQIQSRKKEQKSTTPFREGDAARVGDARGNYPDCDSVVIRRRRYVVSTALLLRRAATAAQTRTDLSECN